MSKRQASAELNHDNWNAPVKPETAGTFQRAASDVIDRRVIKVAQRRSIGSSDSPQSKGSPFAGLKGLNMPSSSSSSSPFSFLNHVKDTTTSPSVVKNGNITNNDKLSFKKDVAGSANDKSKETSQDNKEKSEEYFSKLKGLNESVTDWIRMHVSKNPLCDLTPVFKDYERHLLEIEKTCKSSGGATFKDDKGIFSTDLSKTTTFGSSSNSVFSSKTDDVINKTSSITSNRSPAVDRISQFAFASSSAESKKNISEFTSIFAKSRTETTSSPGKTSTSSPNSVKETNSGKEANSGAMNSFTLQPASKPSIFGPSTSTSASCGISFGSSAANATDGNKKTEDDDYQPPKPVFTPVQEEGAVYSKRCKVFVRKESAYQDRGVGTLYLKPLSSEEKTQLIVRADTSIGNLLINCLLSSSMSPQKMGANHVMLACLPTPESEPPPVPILLKVKNSEDADELLEKLKSFINKSK